MTIRELFPETTSVETRLNYSLDIILQHEGGLSDDRRDPGGITKWGVSLRFLQAAGLDLNNDGKIDRHDVLGLDRPGAKEVYKEHWWDKYQYEHLHDIIVVSKVFDLAVNMGGYHAHKLLQIAINRLNDNPIQVDGIIGPITRQAANKTDGQYLRLELRECAKHRYQQILADHPNMEWARNGWMARSQW